MKCWVPGCNKNIPTWREKKNWHTCSKKCSNAWNWLPKGLREKIRGEKYNKK